MADGRLSEHAGELIDRSAPVSFTWRGVTVEGYQGDTIASALHASGVRVLSRSFKYHRPRGLLCCAGQCPNCIVSADGDPTARACMTPVREGMAVEPVNAWPSLDRDLLHLVGQATPSFGMQVGFYYKTFIRPRWAWRYYEKLLRGAAGLGRIDPDHRRTERYEKVHRHVDTLVLGGGPAGLEAAIEAAEAGRDTALVDEGLALGGHLAWSGHGNAQRAADLAARARAAGVFILQPAWAGGIYEGRLVPVFEGRTMHRFRAGEVVIATGTIEQPLVFEGNDLPGVMLGGAARRLIHQFRLSPGEQAVVVCSDELGIEAAVDLAEAGVGVTAVADTREGDPDERLAMAGIEHLRGFAPVRTRGRGEVTGVVVARDGERRQLNGDLVVMSGGTVMPHGFLTQAGGAIRFDRESRSYVPDRLPEGVRVAGAPQGSAARVPARCASAGGKQFVLLLRGRHHQGHLALGQGGVRLAGALQALHDGHHGALPGQDVPPQLGPGHGRGAGPRPGRPEGRGDHRPAAAQPDHLLTACRTRIRAGQAHVDPPLARRPRRAHAVVGDRKRPYDYGRADSEAAAVHESLGLIDVSTLGKLIVRGPQAAEFLERIYPNRFGDMKTARVRYGIVCGDDGSILDDGTVARLSETEYYVTTTSSAPAGWSSGSPGGTPSGAWTARSST